MSRRKELLERAGAQGLLQDCGTAREVNQALNRLLPQRAEITGIGLDGIIINAWVPSSAISRAARALTETALKFAAREMDLRVPPQRLLNQATGGPLFPLSSMYSSQRSDWIQWRAAVGDFAGGPGEICQNQGIPPEDLVTVKAAARDLLRRQFGKKSRIPPAAAAFIDDEPPDPRSFITVRDYPEVGGFGSFPVNPSKERYQDKMSAWYTLQQIRAWKK